MRRATGALLIAAAFTPVWTRGACATVLAQAPVVNAAVERRPSPQSLAREVQAIAARGTAAWIGYRVPLAARRSATLTALDMCCGRCRLEPPTELLVLARVEAGRIVQLRSIPIDCDIDAAGMPLVWFESVNPDESVRWLESLVTEVNATRDARASSAALLALSRHAAPQAVARLIAIARTHPDSDIRKRAFQHLGDSNDPRAIAFFSDILLK